MKTVQLSEKDNVIYVELNRPELRNAFNSEMIQELTDVFKNLQSRSELKLVVLHGRGKSFCAGADLNWMKSMVNFSRKENLEDAERLYELFEAQKNLDLPIVGWLHGFVFGGALGLVANCDYVICHEDTQFCFSEVKLGISPAVISSFVLKKTTKNIRHYMMSAEIFNAHKAKELGFVNEVIQNQKDKQGIDFPEMNRIIELYKVCGPIAMRKTKKLLREVEMLTWDEQRKLTTELIAELRASSEGQEGIKSFLEKREPSWREIKS